MANQNHDLTAWQQMFAGGAVGPFVSAAAATYYYAPFDINERVTDPSWVEGFAFLVLALIVSIIPWARHTFLDVYTCIKAHIALCMKLMALNRETRRKYAAAMFQSAWRRKDYRAVFGNSISDFSGSWSDLISKPLTRSMQPLVVPFFETYIKQECKNLRSTESDQAGHVIVTTFEAYADFVEQLVGAARATHKGKEIVCFTTLTMPLSKWFNFQDRPSNVSRNEESHECYTINQGWESYTKFMKTLVPRGGNGFPAGAIVEDGTRTSDGDRLADIRIERCLLLVSDKNPYVGHSTFPFFSKQVAAQHYNSPVLVPRINNMPNWAGLLPFKREALAAILRQFREKHNTKRLEDNAFYRIEDAFTILETEEAYPIVPAKANLQTKDVVDICITDATWEPLGKLFAHAFHGVRHKASYCELNDDDWESWYSGSGVVKNMPHDLFAIGTRQVNEPHGSVDWLFFLAARASRDVTRVTLEFSARGFDGTRFGNLKDLVEFLRRESKDLNGLVDAKP